MGGIDPLTRRNGSSSHGRAPRSPGAPVVMVVSSVFPVFALIALGAFLRRHGLTDTAFLRTGDRLVYYAFFPALLFWKIGAGAQDDVPGRLWLAVGATLVAMWILSLVAVAIFRIGVPRAATFSQATFRFNTYVAIAIIGTAQGDAGVVTTGEILTVAIPLVNVLAVTTFIAFQGAALDRRSRLVLTLKAVGRNPLILACIAGMLWARLLPAWPLAVDNALSLASSFTLPFALISIGGALRFEGLGARMPITLLATALKLLVLPLLGWGALHLAGVRGPDFLTGMLFFAMPASTAMYVLATQLDGDADLSASIIVVSTLGSAATLSAVLLLFG